MNEIPEETEQYAERPNKSQIKRDIAELHDLVEEMTQLTRSQLDTLHLPEDIAEAIRSAAGMPAKGARKRLLKFITGLLRKMDIEPVREKLARLQNKSAHAAREHHLVERWRDQLIEQGDDALAQLLKEYPGADRQQLRQMIRNAGKEADAGKPPKSSRLIYRYLRTLFAETAEME